MTKQRRHARSALLGTHVSTRHVCQNVEGFRSGQTLAHLAICGKSGVGCKCVCLSPALICALFPAICCDRPICSECSNSPREMTSHQSTCGPRKFDGGQFKWRERIARHKMRRTTSGFVEPHRSFENRPLGSQTCLRCLPTLFATNVH